MDPSVDTLLATPVEVDGETDERAAFYLRNKTLIETWALLRGDAAVALQRAIHDLPGPLEDDLRRLGVDPITHVDGGKFPVVSMSAAEWVRGPASPISVGIECRRSPLNDRGDLKLYAAVIAPWGHPQAKEYQPAFEGLSVVLQGKLGRQWKTDLPRWPAWKWLTTDEDPWTLDGLVNMARAEALRLWEVAAPEISRLMNEAHPE